MGTAAAAAAARDLFPSMVQVPPLDSRPISAVPGVLPNLLEHQLVWSNIPRGGTSIVLSHAPGVVANLLEHQLVWSNIPRGGTSVALSQDPEIHVSPEALPVDQISPGFSAPPSLIMDDPVPRAMHHTRRGTSIAVLSDIQQSGTLASEPGPASATVGPWSASWAQGTIYFLNFMIVMVLFSAVVAMLQEP
ncbi:uncharacterized protein LOC101780507 [Setaria italica]|nr:uncharacterized protein LOC101780507 [Setaria italica]